MSAASVLSRRMHLSDTRVAGLIRRFTVNINQYLGRHDAAVSKQGRSNGMSLFGMNLLLAQEAMTSAPEVPLDAGNEGIGWIAFLTIIAIIVVPFLLGNAIARALKMKDYATKIGIVLFALTIGLGPFAVRAIEGKNPLEAIDLGIDLAGGTNMTFRVDREAAAAIGKDINSEVMSKMVSAVRLRVNPTGTEEVTVRQVGADQIEVIVPGAEPERVEQVKRLITDLGKLEFDLLANQVDHAALIAQADRLPPDQKEIYRGEQLIGKWRPAALDADGVPKVMPGNDVHYREFERNGKQTYEYLVVMDPDPSKRIDGELLRSVRETMGDKGLAVSFTFNTRGGQLMQSLTSRYQPRPGSGHFTRLAILLNEEIHSAPTINAVIGASGVIEGSFTQEEIDTLLNVLNAGALQVPLIRQPVNEFSISPLLGEDVMRKGITAIVISVIAVFLVTLGYYLVSGFVADVCLACNIILVMGAMSLIDATFTLPGLAGLVLTIGMAVDANVLIFERMREERNKGSSLRMSIKNGFEKAFSTIFDANVTTLITAVVLYYIGTDQVKGFAVTLFIGILTSMFSALFIGRLIFDIAEHKRWLKDLKMMSLIHSGSFDFVGKTKIAVLCSVVLIAVGLVAVGMRGSDNLDIDFRGGSMVTFRFEGDAPSTEEVRERLTSQFDESISLEPLTLQENGQEERLYRLRTIETNAEKVSDLITQAFADSPYTLVRQQVSLGDVREASPPEDSEGEETDPVAEVTGRPVGGFIAEVSLSQPLLPASIRDSAADALANLEGAGYQRTEELITVEKASGQDISDPKATAFSIRIAPPVTKEDVQGMMAAMKAQLEDQPYFEEVNTFDAAVAGEMQNNAVRAMIISLLAIIAYLWIRFQKVTFGLAACVALIHDVLCVLGLVALGAYLSGNPIGSILQLEDFKINLPIIAAFLTIIGYSLNDTIVVFDRIREVRGRNPALTQQMINQSINQTMSRTLLTSSTTLVVVVILYLIGGEGIHGFAYCLLLGILVGTYSSIFIASPALIWLTNRRQKRVASA